MCNMPWWAGPPVKPKPVNCAMWIICGEDDPTIPQFCDHDYCHGRPPAKTIWVTERRARQLGFTDREISQLESMRIEAPNGINWAAYKVKVSGKERDT